MRRRDFLRASATALLTAEMRPRLSALGPAHRDMSVCRSRERGCEAPAESAPVQQAPRAPGSEAARPRAGSTLRPVPSPRQLAWHRRSRGLFVHFGINTFTDREWGDGTEDPRRFAPARLDARQWARAARAGGFGSLILTAKHHDGFCLWPSAYTDHSVRRSPWRDGHGDVVRELTDACRAEGLGAGIYLSPWDRHEPSYGDSPRYNDHFVAQLMELLTRYGPIVEVWFDGANGEGPNGKKQVYDWARYHAVIRRLQPDAVIFSDAGPDIRWIGNEQGTAGDPDWCPVDPDAVPYPGYGSPAATAMLQHGDPHGTVWRPGEADVSIRPGWFWHPAEDARVKSADTLEELYFQSVGRNAGLLLNVPPTTDGLFHPTDVERLTTLGDRLRSLFGSDFARGARATASSAAGPGHGAARVSDGDPERFWMPRAGDPAPRVELELRHPAAFDVVCIGEAIAWGQTVARWAVDAWTGRGWTPVARGTTIGHRRLARIPAVTASRVRLTIEQALDTPRIATLSLHRSGTA